MRLWFVVAGAAGLVIAGCAGPRFQGRPDLTVLENTALPAPTRLDLTAQGRPYLIGPFDKVDVNVFGVEELSREVQADASGRISLPLVGVIEAAGKTPGELAEAIAERLRGRYVRDPQVSVNLTQTVSQVVTVGGEVREPGLYPVVGRMTLMQAVSRARGLTEDARQSQVVLFRRVNDQQMAALYDIRAIRLGAYEDPEVYANDLILVGESNTRRWFRDVTSVSGLLMAPIVALLQSPQ